jgi:hypothetical protein
MEWQSNLFGANTHVDHTLQISAANAVDPVSDSLREFLELAREFITDGRGEAVSISDVAKLLLESARQDRLDFRLEAAELQAVANVFTPAHPKEVGAGTSPFTGRVGVPRPVRAGRLRRAIGEHEATRPGLFHRGPRSTARGALPPNRQGWWP